MIFMKGSVAINIKNGRLLTMPTIPKRSKEWAISFALIVKQLEKKYQVVIELLVLVAVKVIVGFA